QPSTKNKRKSHSNKLFETLIEEQNEKHVDKITYPFEYNKELPQEVDLTLPPDPTRMEDASKMLIEETVSVNIGSEDLPRMIKLGASLLAQEQKTFVEILREY
ncbi:hypothetical protein KI387_008142, partial [Taxus chinensis]